MTPTYTLRNTLLLQMGYSSYGDYLISDLWEKIRTVVMERDDKRCKICSGRAFVVHHLDYNRSTLLGNSLDGLVSICHKCHEEIEFTKEGQKRSLVEALKTYNTLCGIKPVRVKKDIRRVKRTKSKRIKHKHLRCSCCKVNISRKFKPECRPCEKLRLAREHLTYLVLMKYDSSSGNVYNE